MTSGVQTDFSRFVEDLRRAGDEIKIEVGTLIPLAAQAMVSTLQARYPRGKTGNLDRQTRQRSRVRVDPLMPIEQVLGAPHATLWQDGSVERFNYTRKNARRGRMPAAAPRFFQRTAAETRAAMLRKAQAVLDRPRAIGAVHSLGRLI